MNTPHAYPGCYLVELLEEKHTLVLTSEKKYRILSGIILDVGLPMEQKSGGIIPPKCQKGDTVFFLSYEGNYDNFEHEGKTYYAVLFEDGRAYIKGGK